ncbi:hypothetical protein [Streptomyces sp. NPDC055506]
MREKRAASGDAGSVVAPSSGADEQALVRPLIRVVWSRETA